MSATTTETWTAKPAAHPVLHRLTERLERARALDPAADKVAATVRKLIGPGPVKDALSGTWLGHALHPLLTDVPIGTWTSASILDLVGGRAAQDGADRLIGVGIAAAVPTAVSGYSDWADSTEGHVDVKRVGIVHAASNVTALVLYSASLAARRAGNRRRGVVLALAGAGTLSVGGYLGGHLSYAQGIGVDQTTFDPPVEDWTPALPDAELAEGALGSADVAGVSIMLTRQNGRVYALADRCSHRGGPLSEGKVADGCVTCPWHGSAFALEDGSIERGPASLPQPTYDVRVKDGTILVRSR